MIMATTDRQVGREAAVSYTHLDVYKRQVHDSPYENVNEYTRIGIGLNINIILFQIHLITTFIFCVNHLISL